MGFCPATLLSPLGNHTPSFFCLFSSLLKTLFSPRRMCAASQSNAAPGGVQEHLGPRRNPKGPPVAGCRAGSKVGMKRG